MRIKAFTLIELLVVVAIIGILAAVGVVSFSGYSDSAKISAAKSNYNSIYRAWSAIDNYLRFGQGNSFKNPYKPNELSYRHSTSYTNDADVGYVNFSTYLSEVRIWGCFKTPCNDSKNVYVKSIKVVD